MPKARVFYVLTLKSDVKKKDLKKFLEDEWLPILRSTPGCLEVELLDTYHDRAGYCVSELWESRDVHIQRSSHLWGNAKKDLYAKREKYATVEFLWQCIILDS
ncbi:hypothetical protein FJZ33_00350 [Candidatus Poribacteria bacterium]|nr:hypothetical protein [Candidatus Poribacteria bacterium]